MDSQVALLTANLTSTTDQIRHLNDVIGASKKGSVARADALAAYEQVLKTLEALRPLREQNPNLMVYISTTMTKYNKDRIKELIDYAKAHPGELNYASLGTGTSGHLATVMFSELAGIKLQHVPYTSVSQATTDVISGRIAVFLPTLGGHLGNVAAGRMRALAVSGTTRAAQLPDVPTFNELGVKFVDETSWYALFAPKGTRKEIIAKINAELERILALPDVREKGVTLGYRYIGGPPEKLAAFLNNEIAKWAEVAKSVALK